MKQKLCVLSSYYFLSLNQPTNGLIISKHFPPLYTNATFNGTVIAVTALLTLQMTAKQALHICRLPRVCEISWMIAYQHDINT